MKKRIGTVLFLLTFLLLMISCVTSRAYFGIIDNGTKVMLSESQLKKEDFIETDFFVKNIPNAYVSDFNEIIFSSIKAYIRDNPDSKIIHPYDENWQKKDYKEIIGCSSIPDGRDDNFNVFDILYVKYGKTESTDYLFQLKIPDAYENNYEDFALYEIGEIDKAKKSFDKAKWTVENCSSPTIQKSKVVTVPKKIEERHWNPGSAGRRTNSSYGSSEIEEGHWEIYTRTVYVDEVQYYNVANPNYNPNAVREAEKILSNPQIIYIHPFSLEAANGDDILGTWFIDLESLKIIRMPY